MLGAAVRDHEAVHAPAAARRAAPAAVGQRGAPARPLRRPRGLPHARARGARDHGVPRAARLRRALHGLLRPDDRRRAPTPPGTAARRSSTPRWTRSATSGTRTTSRRSARSIWLPSAPAAETLRPPLRHSRGRRLRRRWQRRSNGTTAPRSRSSDDDSAEALEGLGLALWFLGEVAEGIATRERAFDGYARAGRCDDAARVAVWVSHQHLIGGRASAARGWLARAERTLEGIPDCAGHGWVAVERARHAETRGRAGPSTPRARWRSPVTHGDDDLEVFALSLLGRAEVRAGRHERGMRAARGGDGRRHRRPRAQRAHARRGLLQPDHGLRRRRRVGARHRVVRARRRVRAHLPRRRRCSAPAGPSTPTCWSRRAAGPRPSRRCRTRSTRTPATCRRWARRPSRALAELRVRQGRLAEAGAPARRPRGAPGVAARARPAAPRRATAAPGGGAARARAARRRRATPIRAPSCSRRWSTRGWPAGTSDGARGRRRAARGAGRRVRHPPGRGARGAGGGAGRARRRGAGRRRRAGPPRAGRVRRAGDAARRRRGAPGAGRAPSRRASRRLAAEEAAHRAGGVPRARRDPGDGRARKPCCATSAPARGAAAHRRRADRARAARCSS